MPGIGDIDIDGVNERVPCMLVLDTSYSMEGKPMDELNSGLHTLKSELLKDEVARHRVEIAIVTFGPVNLVQDFVTVADFHPPTLHASGTTPMAEAIELAMDKIEQRKSVYKTNQTKYWRPWIMLITDGAPDPGSNWQAAAQRVHMGSNDKKFLFFAIGVEGADMNTLAQISPPQTPPKMLAGTQFGELFAWLSASAGAVTRSAPNAALALPSTGNWSQITS